jgi:hypothetical protein
MVKNKIKSDSTKKEKNNPHYVIPVAAQSYSNIAAVLAGFAFAAVILAMQVKPLDSEKVVFSWATISFILSFVGCIMSAFIFATVTGENDIYPRSYAIALFGGTGFSISTSLVIFGMALLTKVFLTPEVYEFVHIIFPILMLFVIFFVAASALDTILTFDNKPPTKKDYILLFTPSLAPFILAWGIGSSSIITFGVALWGAVAIILSSGIGSLLIVSNPNTEFRFNMFTSGVIVGIHSIALGLFLLIL